MSVLDNVKSFFEKIYKNTRKLQDLDKSDLSDIIQDTYNSNETIVSNLKKLSSQDLKLLKERLMTNSLKSKNKAAKIWTDLAKSYNNASQTYENKQFLGAILNAHIEMSNILKNISEHLDKLFEDRSIKLMNCRMSQIAVLGILEQADVLVNFTSYMLTMLVKLSDDSANDIPGYRNEYLIKHLHLVSDIINDINNQRGRYNFLADVETSRKKGNDVNVINQDGSSLSKFFRSDSNSLMMNKAISGFISSSIFNVFAWPAEAFNRWQYNKNMKNKEMKEWIEVHVAKLRLDLQNVNPNSTEYVKLSKIIDAYDEKIKQLDAKINSYESEAFECFWLNDNIKVTTDLPENADTTVVVNNEEIPVEETKVENQEENKIEEIPTETITETVVETSDEFKDKLTEEFGNVTSPEAPANEDSTSFLEDEEENEELKKSNEQFELLFKEILEKGEDLGPALEWSIVEIFKTMGRNFKARLIDIDKFQKKLEDMIKQGKFDKVDSTFNDKTIKGLKIEAIHEFFNLLGTFKFDKNTTVEQLLSQARNFVTKSKHLELKESAAKYYLVTKVAEPPKWKDNSIKNNDITSLGLNNKNVKQEMIKLNNYLKDYIKKQYDLAGRMEAWISTQGNLFLKYTIFGWNYQKCVAFLKFIFDKAFVDIKSTISGVASRV